MKELISKKIHLDIEDLKKAVENFKVENSQSLQVAFTYTSNIKKFALLLKGLEEKVSKPYKDHLDAIKAKFKPYNEALKTSEAGLKVKMVEYNRVTQKEATDKRIELLKTIDPFDISGRTMELIADLEEKKISGLSFRNKKTLIIEDKSLIPDEYWCLDIKKIEQAVFNGDKVPGATLKIEKIAAVKI